MNCFFRQAIDLSMDGMTVVRYELQYEVDGVKKDTIIAMMYLKEVLDISWQSWVVIQILQMISTSNLGYNKL